MAPVIEVANVHRIYETEAGYTHALRGVSLAIERGEFLCIMGPSGSGKSTLMNILGCLDRPTTGTYRIEGLDTAELNDDELAEIRATRLGFVFQSFNLLPRATVLRNVMLPLVYSACPVAERRERAVRALTAVSMPVESFDHKSNELSGGQMQRVAIARALVNDPALVLADEPTGNLDSATGEMVMQTFAALHAAGKTIVLITHDAEVARWADRVVFIRDGKLYEDPAGVLPARPSAPAASAPAQAAGGAPNASAGKAAADAAAADAAPSAAPAAGAPASASAPAADASAGPPSPPAAASDAAGKGGAA